MISNPSAPRLAAVLAVALSSVVAGPAAARRNGIQIAGCDGCHGQNSGSTITLTPDHDPIAPGDDVNFVATIAWPGVEVGGIYVPKPDLGTLGTSAGQGLTLSSGALTHTSPKAAAGDTVTFSFTWTAPDEPGSVLVGAYFVAGNNNGQYTGDSPGGGYLSFVWGCEPQTLYYDIDGDGHGTPAESAGDPGTLDSGTLVGCADQPPPPHYSALDDDCDDLVARVYPGAPERCNGEDDDCDGDIDEETEPEMLYPDLDGDGYYSTTPGDPVVGCLPLEGYADQPGDCAPTDPERHPDAEEVCNLYDDDCDGLTDEDSARPRCGEGRCSRVGPTCNAEDCIPGTPMTETCNGLDDDCDGEVDDGDLCAPGEQCLGIQCVLLEPTGDETGGSAGDGGGNGGSAPTSGSGESGGTGGGATQGGSSTDSNGGGTVGAAGEAGGSPATGGEPNLRGGTNTDDPAPEGTSGKSSGCAFGHERSSGAAGLGFLVALAVGGVRRRRRARSAIC